jgi:hypothetical protein
MKKNGVQGSVISLSAQIFMLQKMCEVTRGEFMLSKNKGHFQDLLKRCLVPREQGAKKGDDSDTKANPMIKMAFPTREVQIYPAYCVCHNEPKFQYYKCPNCSTPQCEISAACKVCKVMLVSAVHLSSTTQTSSTVA